MGASWADSKSKKSSFWSVVFSYSTQQQTISRSDCDVWWKVGFIDNKRRPAQWLDREEASKHFPKPNLHQKKVMVSVWWSVAGLIRYNFVNPGDTITFEKYAQQIDEMCWKLQHLQPALVNRKGPILLHNNAQPHVTQPRYKSWTNWSTKFCLICLIHLTFLQLTTTFSSILTTFCREDSSITSRRQKMF